MIPYSFKILADILHLHIRNDSCDFRLMASVFFTACDTKPFAGSRVSPRRRLTFNETNCVGFLASPRKVSKSRRPHCPCPFGAPTGNLRCLLAGRAAELAARWRAPLKQTRPVRAPSWCVLRHTSPPCELRPWARAEGQAERWCAVVALGGFISRHIRLQPSTSKRYQLYFLKHFRDYPPCWSHSRAVRAQRKCTCLLHARAQGPERRRDNHAP